MPLRRLMQILRRSRPDERGDSIASIRRELDKRPEEIDSGTVVPLLVPNSFAETGSWPGPIYRLAAPGFCQTWATLGPKDVIRYVDRSVQNFWENGGIPWRERAASNLRAIAETQPYSHQLTRDDGSVFMVGMLFGQGLGPSRLLVPGLLNGVFPDGYKVAIPEMTCAFAFIDAPTDEERHRIHKLIQGCFDDGSEPVSTEHMSPQLLWETASADLGM